MHTQAYLDRTPKDHAGRVEKLYDLGMSYHKRYCRIGDIEDLETSIQRWQEALNILPDEHPDQADLLSILGIGYQDRYKRMSTRADLDMAIQKYKEALDNTSPNHPYRAKPFDGLGEGYHARYNTTGAMVDLDIAIQYYQNALDATPKGNQKSNAQSNRTYRLGTGYLKVAIHYCQKAIDITPKDHPSQELQFHTLGRLYHDKYNKTKVLADLEIAIQQYQKAFDIVPENSPHCASRHCSFGFGYRQRYEKTGIAADLEKAIQQFQKGLDHSLSPPLDRLKSSKVLFTFYIEAKNWKSAYQAASAAVSLIPLLTSHSLEISDKQYLLTNVAGLASDAAAIALMADRTIYEAIQLLELGRGIIVGSASDLRADISHLHQKDQQLAERFIELRDHLNNSTRQTHQINHHQLPTGLTGPADQRYSTARELEQTIRAIRALPDFDRFLLTPSEDELKLAAVSGPIVFINVSDYRCDALIIEKHKLQALLLPHLHSNDVRARATTLGNLDELDMSLLEWLWNTIAEPVLNTLGFIEIFGDSWPRIWWIPTGPLTKFPIHAAGSRNSSVLDRVTSSYSASIRALVQSRQRRSKAKVVPEEGKAVFVGMERTPGCKRLPGVPKEIEMLSRLCGSTKFQVTRPQTHRSDVISALQDCRIFHFAGHGLTDQENPSNSSLILSDGLLAVASLFELNLHNHAPFLAYLSACGTGEIKQDSLTDEALHLISACQFAGFQHVIGTLWKVNDETCIETAAKTYEWMIRENMSDNSVAEGLHKASRQLRAQWLSESAARTAARVSERMAGTYNEDGPPTTEQARSSQGTARDPRTAELYEDPPLYWVPYVHFGI
ncbi:hypothetical protein EPUS_09421 [Endocarpon pusillum Z07020]|uniref:CHAT domain-containing protein n=1 Tax=Endocarpon pusillum (strain Z07020 / HMAS-L-300199) TaxID=1263415 RepID=U1GBF8_ENDPU|nr:uncharacterized protein EPUS_09421 [Endocarpon pusillum Z07020]ERF74882.1 hypothetical protein EPUS_09421 [Endocarpon pusillum Z07020]